MPYTTKSAQLCPIIVYDEKTMINDWKDVKKCQAIDAGSEDSACTGTYDFNMLSSARCCDYNSYPYNAFRSLIRHFFVR